MAALTVFLLVCGNSVSAVLLILIVWALILLAGLVLTYWKRKRQMKKLLDMAEQLSERYLISEIKTPITAMKLLCENHRTDWTKELLLELEKTNRFTEQALYYARSEHTEKDYSVRESFKF